MSDSEHSHTLQRIPQTDQEFKVSGIQQFVSPLNMSVSSWILIHSCCFISRAVRTDRASARRSHAHTPTRNDAANAQATFTWPRYFIPADGAAEALSELSRFSEGIKTSFEVSVTLSTITQTFDQTAETASPEKGLLLSHCTSARSYDAVLHQLPQMMLISICAANTVCESDQASRKFG